MHTRIVLHSVLFLFATTVFAGDWPQYRGPTSDGRTQEKIGRAWANAGPKRVWKVASEGGFSSFAVGGGRAFTLALKQAGGTKQESIVALDADSGRELWFAPLNPAKYDGGGDSGVSGNNGGDGPRSTPTTDGRSVYVMSAQLALRSFDGASGKPIWTRDLLKEHAGRNISWQNAASPLLAGGLLYVAGGGPGQSILAVNPKDGAVVWKAFDEQMTHATPIAANILGQPQIIFFVQSGLLAVDPKSGKELWRYPFQYNTSTAASPVVWQDIVYCSAGYGVGAAAVKISKQGEQFVPAEIYRVRGNKPLANHWSTPVVKDGLLFGMFQFKEYGSGPLKCVDIATGNVKWEKEGFGPGQVILAGDQVLALSDAGELVLIEARADSYKELARADVLDGKCWTMPVLANGRVYARSTKEAVCLDVR
jgi:outer membrane protein assembly factor BamB